jgi:4a-hydroxytetrahydrobiopterin dehydratase
MKLPRHEVDARLAAAPAWAANGEAITRQFKFKSFADAMAFVVRLGFAAEAADHHPDLGVSHRKVTVTWSTHSAGGVTEKDFAGARETDGIAATCGAA